MHKKKNCKFETCRRSRFNRGNRVQAAFNDQSDQMKADESASHSNQVSELVRLRICLNLSVKSANLFLSEPLKQILQDKMPLFECAAVEPDPIAFIKAFFVGEFQTS